MNPNLFIEHQHRVALANQLRCDAERTIRMSRALMAIADEVIATSQQLRRGVDQHIHHEPGHREDRGRSPVPIAA